MPYIFEHDVPTIELAPEIHGESGMLTGQDYVAETDLTASNVFSPENVGVIEFTNALAAAVHAAQQMDKFKKALFRKRTREESGLPEMEPQPLLSEALGERVGELDDLFHGIVGIITETGEAAEILYNLLAANKEPDLTNVKEEIGDHLWYLARLIKWAKTTFPKEMRRNITKLRSRHGAEGFSKEGDINRDLAREREVLEGLHEGIPDPRCPECGADVDENCENLDNCPRHGTGEYAHDGLEHKNEGLADHPNEMTDKQAREYQEVEELLDPTGAEREAHERNVQFIGGEGEEVLD